MPEDHSLWVTGCGRHLYIDFAVTEQGWESTSPIPEYPLSETFSLESNPGADMTIYLNAQGRLVDGAAWLELTGTTALQVPAWDTDGDPESFSDAELADIQATWADLAEAYAAFDVNVTTKVPTTEQLDRNQGDSVWGLEVMLTGDGPVSDACDGCIGLAFVGVNEDFSDGSTFWRREDASPAFIFVPNGVVAAHEIGHTFGLNHHGIQNGPAYANGNGDHHWAPIMGFGNWGRPAHDVWHWSRGNYPRANLPHQDDLAVIEAGVPGGRRADLEGGPIQRDAALPTEGVISTAADSDRFTFSGGPDLTRVEVKVRERGLLDAQLTIRDEAGQVVAVVNPKPVGTSWRNRASRLGAQWYGRVPVGQTWSATVAGVGTGAVRTGKYDDYSSLGSYQITVSSAVCTVHAPDPGTPGDDIICGTDGNEILRGMGGDDVLLGFGGNDALHGGPGHDLLIGGPGADTASYAASARAVTADLAANGAIGEGNDVFVGIERIRGSRGNDHLSGSARADWLWGMAGNDQLHGRGGNDRLMGGPGLNRLYGGPGRDFCSQGARFGC